MRLLLIVLLLWTSTASAQQQDPHADADAVRAFIDGSAVPCQTRAAQACVDAGFRFAARDPRKGLTLDDVRTLRRRLGAWYGQRYAELAMRERGAIGLGLLLADGLGVERLHQAFDSNGDGSVTQKELLADIKLDSRPLGVVLIDPVAVDRAGLARRLGLPPGLVDRLFQ